MGRMRDEASALENDLPLDFLSAITNIHGRINYSTWKFARYVVFLESDMLTDDYVDFHLFDFFHKAKRLGFGRFNCFCRESIHGMMEYIHTEACFSMAHHHHPFWFFNQYLGLNEESPMPQDIKRPFLESQL